MIFALAEILGLEKFGQADDLSAAPSGVGDAAEGLLQILFRLRTARHLYQRHAEFFRGQAIGPPGMNIAGALSALRCPLCTSVFSVVERALEPRRTQSFAEEDFMWSCFDWP